MTSPDTDHAGDDDWGRRLEIARLLMVAARIEWETTVMAAHAAGMRPSHIARAAGIPHPTTIFRLLRRLGALSTAVDDSVDDVRVDDCRTGVPR